MFPKTTFIALNHASFVVFSVGVEPQSSAPISIPADRDPEEARDYAEDTLLRRGYTCVATTRFESIWLRAVPS